MQELPPYARQVLEVQADRIEMVLASHKVGGKVWGGNIGPRCVTFHLMPTASARVRSLSALNEEIALALGVSHCRVYREQGCVRIEVPRMDQRRVSLLRLCRSLPPMPPATAVLGQDKTGLPLLVRLTSPDVVHILIAGTTGSGKTEALRALLASLVFFNRQSECQMVLLDPKSQGLLCFCDLPHLLCPPITEVQPAKEALGGLVGEMERRDRAGVRSPSIVLAIDELADLIMQGGSELEAHLTRLVQRGRGAGIHVVAATQRPAAAVMSSLMRSNFPMRIVGRVLSAQDAHIATGVSGTGAETLEGTGDMLAVVQGRVIRFQGAFIGEPDIRRLAAGLASRRVGSPPWLSAEQTIHS